MMRKAILFFLVHALFFSLGTVDVQAKVKVFIMAGESNAVGVNSSASLLPAVLKQPQAHIMFKFEEGTRASIQNTSQRISSIKFRPLLYQTDFNYGTFGRFDNGFGPEMKFAYDLAGLIIDDLAIVKFAFNDTTLALDWNASMPGILYGELLAFIADSMDLLNQIGLTAELAGFIWMQGESDAANMLYAANYNDNLTALIQNVRADLNVPDLPFILGRLNENIHLSGAGIDPANLETVRTAQANVASSLPFTSMVDTDEFQIDFDMLHFYATGQLMLGHRFATAYLGLTHDFLPVNITFEDTRSLLSGDIVHHAITGPPSAHFMVFISAGGGILPTQWGFAGLDLPAYLGWSGFLDAGGTSYNVFHIPQTGPAYVSFFTHALVDASPPTWCHGGNNPNGSQSIWWVIN